MTSAYVRYGGKHLAVPRGAGRYSIRRSQGVGEDVGMTARWEVVRKVENKRLTSVINEV